MCEENIEKIYQNMLTVHFSEPKMVKKKFKKKRPQAKLSALKKRSIRHLCKHRMVLYLSEISQKMHLFEF